MTRWLWRLKARCSRSRALWVDAQLQVLGDGADAGMPLVDWFKAHPGQAVELMLPGALQHQLLCDAELPLGDSRAVRDYALQQFIHYFGEVAQRWSLAPWRIGTSPGATALQGLDLQALCRQAAAAGVDLRAARPAWAMALSLLSAARQRAGARTRLVWVEGAVACVLELDGGRCRGLMQRRLREASQSALDDLLQEQAAWDGDQVVVGYGLQADVALHDPAIHVLGSLSASGPAQLFTARPPGRVLGFEAPDFLRQGEQRSAWAWPLALTGVLTLATASADAWQLHQAGELALQGLQRLQAQATLTSPRSGAPQEPRLDATALTRLGQVRQDLAFPWEALVADLERVAEAGTVQWLGLETQAASSGLRLEGWATDRRAALQVAESLGQQPGWTQVLVGQVQSADGGQRFELTATLEAGRLMPPARLGAPR